MDLFSELGRHSGFIVGAYGFTLIAIGGLICHALLDQRAQKRALAELQSEGSARER